MPSRMRGVVVDAEHAQAVERDCRRALAGCASTRPAPAPALRSTGRITREARALARVARRCGFRACSTRAMRSTIDRPRPRPCASRAPSSSRVNSLEHRVQLVAGDADAGVDHLDFGQLAAPPHADQDAAAARVFDGVGDEVLDQPAQQVAVGVDRQRRRHDRAASSFFSAAMRHEIGADLAQQPAELKHGFGRLHGAGVEPRDVEHGAEDGLDRFQRGFDVRRPPRRCRPCRPSRSATSSRGARR